ncbi:BON domain-containing protein [Sorangium atrum]|uniref:BON domain-containing protein n=1 Tax=Sorangium atrum TaxID=2995308 RepID=A0ABT5BYP3_9BACT|nr:BON domain-containing protein [Sorangium aterium]MDC0679277.1 BON domain-containing protein [Sorangium aterium]
MRDRFDRDTGYGRNEPGWDQRYRDDRGHFTERGYPRDERRSAGPIYDHGAAPRDGRDGGREHARTGEPATHRDPMRRASGDGRFANSDSRPGDQERGWPHDDRGGDHVGGRDDGHSFGGNPLPAVGSAYNFNLGGAYYLGMTRVVNPDYGPDAAWRGGAYRDESHDLGESGHSALESVGHALGEIGDRVRRAFGRGPKGYKRSDARIQEDICETLSERHDIDVSDVTVQVENNEVILEGTVPQRHHKRIIELVAEGTRGVEDVHNRIRVQRGMESTTRSTATTGTMGDAALAGTAGGATPDGEPHGPDLSPRAGAYRTRC